MGFEQEAMQAMRDEMHNGRSTMWRQVESTCKGEPYVLRQLLKSGTQTPSQLAQGLHASSGRISALLGTLEKKGYVTRQIDENDRRNILVSLTDAGASQANRDKEDIDSAVRWIFSQMGERRTREYVNLTQEFMTYMSVCRPGEPRPDHKVIAQAFAERAARAEAQADQTDSHDGKDRERGSVEASQ
jgi:MarR family transcriptional regulator, 2-MHQ and catechol-resistance regulon repressor